ncbi:MAG: hypothetical protein OHK0017_02180 [Patescibacteria group bacterium]
MSYHSKENGVIFLGKGSRRDSKPRFSRGGNGGGFRGGRRNSRPNFQRIDYSRFISKEVPKTVEEKVVSTAKFSDFNLQKDLLDNLTKLGYQTPTPIQERAIPEIMQGKDVIGLANTGTGKTLAFLVPLVDKLLKAKKEGKKSYNLILAPTRELALQIEEELIKITNREMMIFSTCCVGGRDIRRQMKRLERPNQFVIATPGRLMDLVDRRVIDLKMYNNLVLDEVDRMLDMGFIDDIESIIERLPAERQSLFFSATTDKKTQGLMNKFLQEPSKIAVENNQASPNVVQDIVKVGKGESKEDILTEILNQDEMRKVLIFCETKMDTENLSYHLSKKGHRVESIHGDKTQGSRIKALKRFKEGAVTILIGTDVAARGLDMDDISHVINFAIPKTYEDYIHRIGRTGRGGKTGNALTFVD